MSRPVDPAASVLEAGGPSMRRRRPRPPLAEELRDAVARDLILSDLVPPGSLLPSEKELSARYGVSRPTVREALLMLQQAGLVATRHGVGSFVLPRPHALTNGLDRLCSIETFAREAGESIETQELEWEEVLADAEMAQRLGIPLGHQVLIVRRMKSLHGVPVGVIHDHIPAGVLGFDLLRSEFHGSTLDVILDHPELGAEYADSEIVPVSLDHALADRLQVAPGSAALLIDTVVSTVEGRALDWGVCWYLPQHFRFSVRRRRQIGERFGSLGSRFAAVWDTTV
jgi:DNA-binding GntR family transcriptional regulator